MALQVLALMWSWLAVVVWWLWVAMLLFTDWQPERWLVIVAFASVGAALVLRKLEDQ